MPDPHATAEAHHHDHGPSFPHGSMRDYVTGFVLSVILTAIPFFLVMSGIVGSGRLTAFLVLACAVAHGVDYFFTNDRKLSRINIDGIGEIIYLKSWYEARH